MCVFILSLFNDMQEFKYQNEVEKEMQYNVICF